MTAALIVLAAIGLGFLVCVVGIIALLVAVGLRDDRPSRAASAQDIRAFKRARRTRAGAGR